MIGDRARVTHKIKAYTSYYAGTVELKLRMWKINSVVLKPNLLRGKERVLILSHESCARIHHPLSLFYISKSVLQAVVTVLEPPETSIATITNEVSNITSVMIVIGDYSCSDTND